MTGLEDDVWNQFLKLKTDWIPIGKTIYLEQDNETNEIHEILEKLDNVQGNIEDVNGNFFLNKKNFRQISPN